MTYILYGGIFKSRKEMRAMRNKYQLEKERKINNLALDAIENKLKGALVNDWEEKELIDLLELKLDLISDIETLQDELNYLEEKENE